MAKTTADLHAAVVKLRDTVKVMQRAVSARIARPPADLSDHVAAVEEAITALNQAASELDKSTSN